MSNAIGYVYDTPSTDSKLEHGETLGYFIYFGSNDSACTAIFSSADAAWKANRTDAAYADCTCDKASKHVILHSTYGNGFSWESMACFRCNAITGYRSRWEEMVDRGRENNWMW